MVRIATARLPLSRAPAVKALKDRAGGGGGANGGFAGQSWDPGLEIEVPFEQRPVISIRTMPKLSPPGASRKGRGS